MTPTKTSPGLVRVLGPWMATAIVVGTIIGSGVFKKPQAVASNVHFFGPAALVWVIGGLLTLLGALTYAEVVAMFPRAGGNYVFLREAYGPLFGFLWGWVDFCIIRTASMAALATVCVDSLNDVIKSPAFQEAVGLASNSELHAWARLMLTVVLILTLGLVNVRGVRWGGGLNFVVTMVKMATLLAILCLPFILWGRTTSATTSQPDLANLSPVWPDDWSKLKWSGFTTALLGVLFAYHGWGNIAPVAEEVRNPGRNLPLALLAGVGIVLVLYLGANFAYALMIPQSEMAGFPKTTTVATQFSLRLLGPIGAALTSAAIMCSTFGALNGNCLVGPRLLYAMGVDRVVPRVFGDVHARFHTPVLAIMVYAGWAAALVLIVAALMPYEIFKDDPFDTLTNFAMFGSITFESLGVLSIFVFRRRLPNAERPYRCWGYPVVPMLFGMVELFIIAGTLHDQPVLSAAGVGFFAVGVAVYYAFVKR